MEAALAACTLVPCCPGRGGTLGNCREGDEFQWTAGAEDWREAGRQAPPLTCSASARSSRPAQQGAGGEARGAWQRGGGGGVTLNFANAEGS